MNQPVYEFERDEHEARVFDAGERAVFITRTYGVVAIAVAAFVCLEIAFFRTGFAERIMSIIGSSQSSWMIALGAYMVVSWLATRVASQAASLPMQAMALAGFVVVESVIFVPLLWIAKNIGDPNLLANAVVITLVGFAGLTAVAFITRKDFSFLRSVLVWGGFVAIGLIIASFVFGLSLGIWFSVGMIALMGASILYDTSNVIHHYPEDRYVGAGLQLFASLATLFWYVLRLLISLNDD